MPIGSKHVKALTQYIYIYIFLLLLHGPGRKTGSVRGTETRKKKKTRKFDESMILRNNGLWEAGIQSQRGGRLASGSIQRPRVAR